MTGSAADAKSPNPSAGHRRSLHLDGVDSVIKQARDDDTFPGAGVLVLRNGAVLKRAAYGYALLYADATERLTRPIPTAIDTLFDLASLTKLFTATAVMQLVERGNVVLDEPAYRYLPGLERGARAAITVRHLLVHTSGLPPGRPFYRHRCDAAMVIAVASRVRPVAPPGAQVLYSDLNYILLGGIVAAAAGLPLDRYLAVALFEPLEMRDTCYRPAPSVVARTAATEYQNGRGMVRGNVHDENAAAMGGVSGHAGVFGTVDDVATFGAMFLNAGTHGTRQILRPQTVAQMLSIQTGALRPARGLGWLCDDASLMGGLASRQTFGHTGFTGTSIVLDPRRRLCVVLLTNRVHPTRFGPGLSAVRAAVADAAALL
jgi:CubicO group peptidase (beta-lactamase class C family)